MAEGPFFRSGGRARGIAPTRVANCNQTYEFCGRPPASRTQRWNPDLVPAFWGFLTHGARLSATEMAGHIGMRVPNKDRSPRVPH